MVGIEIASDGPGRVGGAPLTPAEEEEFRALAARPDIYEAIAKSIAPSIYGSTGKEYTINTIKSKVVIAQLLCR